MHRVIVTGVLLLYIALSSGSLMPPLRAQSSDTPAAPQAATTIYLPLLASPAAPQAPQISSFRADPAAIKPGEATTLSWNVSGATSLRIEPGVGPVTGPVQVRPAVTTTYTLIAVHAGGESRATTIVTVGNTAPAPVEGAILFGNDSLRSSDIVVDGQGGMHTVFSKIPPLGEGEKNATFYAYCAVASTCNTDAGWKFTGIIQDLSFPWVQLAVTPEGKPRLLLMRTIYPDDGSFFGGKQYVYGECNSDCSQSANWGLIEVLTSKSGGGMYDSDFSYRNFALDHLGRPRFVYEDRANSSGDHAGAYYVFCNSNCTDGGSWSEMRLDPHNDNVYIDEKSVLAFSADGKPGILAMDGNIPTRVVYLECANDCTQSSDWSVPAHLYDVVSGPGHRAWSLAFDPQGRPRMAFYPGGGPLYYAWCNGNCATASNWDSVQVPLTNEDSGEHPALALDNLGRPRIAYRDVQPYGLGYAFCNENCESAQGVWKAGNIEDDNQLNREFPINPLPHCDTSTWFGGLRNQLSLDPQGNPRIAYDAELMMRCKRYPDDPNNNQTFVEVKWWTVRVFYFEQPK